jgi:hypothetical protein
MPEMAVTLLITMTNDKKQRTINYSKQTQSNPISKAMNYQQFFPFRSYTAEGVLGL